jgi:heat shock protein HslJ
MTRTRKLLVPVLALALALGVAACGSDSDSSDSGTGPDVPAELDGTWTLMNIASQGAATSLPNTVEAPTLEFSDGNVDVFTGCNSGSGSAEIGDSTIEFGSIALTKKSCDEMSNQVETFVSQTLKGETGYKVQQGNLIIEGDQADLIFVQE